MKNNEGTPKEKNHVLRNYIKWIFAHNGKSDYQEETSGKRLRVLSYFLAAFFGFLIIYFAYLMFLQGPKLSAQVDEYQKRTFVTEARRGNITDTNGKLMAVTVESANVDISIEIINEYGYKHYNPNAEEVKEEEKPTGLWKRLIYEIKKIINKIFGDDEKKELTEEERLENQALYRELVASKLSELLNVDKALILDRFEKQELNWWNIGNDVDASVGEELKNWISEEKIKGVNVSSDTKRYYPFGATAAHVVGFTGTDDKGLVCGVEMEMDSILAGTDGKTIAVVEKNGNSITGKEKQEIEEKKDGLNVQLTIDTEIQKIAERELNAAVDNFHVLEGGAVIIMDPHDASILAMASNPTFDLNNPRDIDEEAFLRKYFWRNDANETNVLSSMVWRNKALSSTYEPGSTFKVITACVAIEENIVTPETEVDDTPLSISGWTIHCSTAGKAEGHGSAEIFRLGVANSCNPVMARVALEAGIDTYYSYVKSFGFYNKTNVLLSGEAVGVIHTAPTDVDLACMAFGQRFTITPMQLTTAYCAIANGGTLYEPRLVKSLTDNDGNVVQTFEPKEVRQIISEDTAKTVRDMLEGVVRDGTGARGYITGYRVAGKTGTSETTTTDKDGRYIVSFCAIAPADDPKIVCLVMLDHPTKGNIAGATMGASLATRVIKPVLNYMQVPKVYTESDESKIKGVYFLPDYVGKPLEDVLADLKTQSTRLYSIEIIGEVTEGCKVVRQEPTPDQFFCREGTVVLYVTSDETLEPDYVKVPDCTGMSICEAHSAITGCGLNADIRADGKVVEQSIAPGTSVKKGTIVVLKMKVDEGTVNDNETD